MVYLLPYCEGLNLVADFVNPCQTRQAAAIKETSLERQ